MFTIIGGDGQEYGPASAQQLRSWMAAGRVNLETKAKSVGTDEWRRLGDFPEFAENNAQNIPPPLQSRAPQNSAGPVDAGLFAADLIARTSKLDVFSCLDRSFQLWKANFLPLVGVTLLVFLAQMLLNVVPLIGPIAGILFNGVFYGGLYYYYLGKMRGDPRSAGDVFAGFRIAFVPLMLATLLTTILSFAAMMVFSGAIVWPVMIAAFSGDAASFQMPVVTPLMFGALAIGFLLMIYLSVSWIFTFALIIDQGLGTWTAMEVSRRVVTRQWFRVFFVALLGGLLALVGLIGFFIGILFTLPLTFGAILYAYEDLCNPPQATNRAIIPEIVS